MEAGDVRKPPAIVEVARGLEGMSNRDEIHRRSSLPERKDGLPDVPMPKLVEPSIRNVRVERGLDTLGGRRRQEAAQCPLLGFDGMRR